jgi:8-oxo-dGTP diphosphatase
VIFIKRYEVVAAILFEGDEILCMQRGPGKYPYTSFKFEFPGGKVEPGESHTAALQRELKEEMDLDVRFNDSDHFLTVQHVYPDFKIVMHSYLSKVPNRKFKMNDHVASRWMSAGQLFDLDWAEADRPIVEALIKRYAKKE